MTENYVSPLVYRPEHVKNTYMIERESEVLGRVLDGEVSLIPSRDKDTSVFKPFHARFTKKQEDTARTLIKRVWSCVNDIRDKVTEESTIKQVTSLIHDWFATKGFPHPPQGLTEPVSSDLIKGHVSKGVTPYVRLRPSYNVQGVDRNEEFIIPKTLPFPVIGQVEVFHVYLPFEPRSILLVLLEDGAISAYYERPTLSLRKVKKGYQFTVGFKEDGTIYGDKVYLFSHHFPDTLLPYPDEYIELLHKREDATNTDERIALTRKINGLERRIARRLSLQMTDDVTRITIFNPPQPREYKRPISMEDRFHAVQRHMLRCVIYHTLRKGGEVYFHEDGRLNKLTGRSEWSDVDKGENTNA